MRVISLIFWCLFMAVVSSAADLSVETCVCDLELPQQLKQANLSFSVIYSFTVNASGEPKEVSKLVNDHVSDEQVRRCLAKYRLRGFAEGTKFGFSQHWEHGVGWDILIVGAPGFTQSVTIPASLAPHRTRKGEPD